MTIYGYARESTRKQDLGLKAQIIELKQSGCDVVISDLGQSGDLNLLESAEWKKIADKIQSGDTLKVWTQSRLGRDNHEVGHVISRLVKRGIAIHILDGDRVIDDLDDFGQNSAVSLKGLMDHSELVQIRKNTKQSLKVLTDAGVTLGRKPILSDKHIVQIKDLRSRGLGFSSIGKIVRTQRKNGDWVNTSPRTVKAVLDGTYVTREEFDLRNANARRAMLPKG